MERRNKKSGVRIGSDQRNLHSVTVNEWNKVGVHVLQRCIPPITAPKRCS